MVGIKKQASPGGQDNNTGASPEVQRATVDESKEDSDTTPHTSGRNSGSKKSKSTTPTSSGKNGSGSKHASPQNFETADVEDAETEDAEQEEPSGNPVKPLTTTNLDKFAEQQQQEQRQQVTSDEEYEEYHPAPPTTDERLEQARIFLSEEDVNLHRDFARKHQEVEAYLRKIADERTPCNLNVYHEVKIMLDVHTKRMDKQRYEGNRPIDYSRLPKHSQRLGLRDMSERASLRGAPLREDHPPFTLERKPDHNEFLSALRADTDHGRELRTLEAEAYDATLVDSSLVNEYLEERAAAEDEAEDAIAERFRVRATKRGRRRAAVQIALRSFARNFEQHFAGGWDHRVVRLPPAPPEKPAEPIMFMPLDRDQRPERIYPYRYTKKVVRFQEEQRLREQDVCEKLAQPDTDIEPIEFPKPSHKRAVIKARCENRFRALALLLFDVIVALASEEATEESRKIGAGFVELSVLPALLEIGDVKLPQQTKVRLALEFLRQDRDWLKNAIQRGSDVEPLDSQGISVLQQFIESQSPTLDQTIDGLMSTLAREIAELFIHIEQDRFEAEHLELRERSRKTLRNWRQIQYRDDPSRRREHGKHVALQALAQPLNGNEGEVSHSEAINLLSDQILWENHANQRPQKVTHDEMWSFAPHLPAEMKSRNFFSIDQWSGFKAAKPGEEACEPGALKSKADEANDSLPFPFGKRPPEADADSDSLPLPKPQHTTVTYKSLNPDDPNPSRRLPPEEIGFVQVQEASREHTPEIGSGDLMPPEIMEFDFLRDGHVLENAPDMKEDHQEGLPFFPFAETPFMQAIMGRQIEDDMVPCSLAPASQRTKAAPADPILPTQQFSLPQPFIGLSSDILKSSGIFNQRLNLIKRTSPESDIKRKRPAFSPSSDLDEPGPERQQTSPHDPSGKRKRSSPGPSERDPKPQHTSPGDPNGKRKRSSADFNEKDPKRQHTSPGNPNGKRKRSSADPNERDSKRQHTSPRGSGAREDEGKPIELVEDRPRTKLSPPYAPIRSLGLGIQGRKETQRTATRGATGTEKADLMPRSGQQVNFGKRSQQPKTGVVTKATELKNPTATTTKTIIETSTETTKMVTKTAKEGKAGKGTGSGFRSPTLGWPFIFRGKPVVFGEQPRAPSSTTPTEKTKTVTTTTTWAPSQPIAFGQRSQQSTTKTPTRSKTPTDKNTPPATSPPTAPKKPTTTKMGTGTGGVAPGGPTKNATWVPERGLLFATGKSKERLMTPVSVTPLKEKGTTAKEDDKDEDDDVDEVEDEDEDAEEGMVERFGVEDEDIADEDEESEEDKEDDEEWLPPQEQLEDEDDEENMDDSDGEEVEEDEEHVDGVNQGRKPKKGRGTNRDGVYVPPRLEDEEDEDVE